MKLFQNCLKVRHCLETWCHWLLSTCRRQRRVTDTVWTYKYLRALKLIGWTATHEFRATHSEKYFWMHSVDRGMVCTCRRASLVTETSSIRVIPHVQWRRFLVEYTGVRVSQVKPSNCFSPLEKLVYLPFLTQVFHPWRCETCRVIQQQFWMKECDFLGGGCEKILWPLLYIFRQSRPPTPTLSIYAPPTFANPALRY